MQIQDLGSPSHKISQRATSQFKPLPTIRDLDGVGFPNINRIPRLRARPASFYNSGHSRVLPVLQGLEI
ncbi:hypothetical protein I79_009127 [Cricetulus griseus]|uniref:Uncharacterized protein n=1 Tax=Cricetulus griseus TaxID=10029 RepID=G3HEY0_CRIGR|nr:hypothetical protein I79_009127 [Cricetulus griseus]